jgi:hypothetical protein
MEFIGTFDFSYPELNYDFHIFLAGLNFDSHLFLAGFYRELHSFLDAV